MSAVIVLADVRAERLAAKAADLKIKLEKAEFGKMGTNGWWNILFQFGFSAYNATVPVHAEANYGPPAKDEAQVRRTLVITMPPIDRCVQTLGEERKYEAPLYDGKAAYFAQAELTSLVRQVSIAAKKLFFSEGMRLPETGTDITLERTPGDTIRLLWPENEVSIIYPSRHIKINMPFIGAASTTAAPT